MENMQHLTILLSGFQVSILLFEAGWPRFGSAETSSKDGTVLVRMAVLLQNHLSLKILCLVTTHSAIKSVRIVTEHEVLRVGHARGKVI